MGKALLISKNGFRFLGIGIEIKIFLYNSFLILGRVFVVFPFPPEFVINLFHFGSWARVFVALGKLKICWCG